MNVICLAIDRLHSGYLGAYGNTWINTPAFDALAAQSIVLDRATIDSPQLETLYRSLWLGLHALCPRAREAGRKWLPALFSEAGWQTALLTDEARLAAISASQGFGEILPMGAAQSAAGQSSKGLAETIEETAAAAFFSEAAAWLESARQPFFLWLHTGTLGQIWDAPLEFRQQYADENDPDPSTSAHTPNQKLPKNFDPDALLAITQAYAGQVTLVDQLLGSLLTQIAESGWADETLLVCLSPRGFPLGEHHRVGSCDDALYSELTHVPVFLRLPKNFSLAGRWQTLIQPADLGASILDCCALEFHDSSINTISPVGCGRSFLPLLRGERETGFDRACVVAPNEQRRIVTPAWSMRVSSPSAAESVAPAEQAELFVQPDDWFEVNEVSNRCPGVVQKLQAALAEFAAACESAPSTPLAPLADDLALGFD